MEKFLLSTRANLPRKKNTEAEASITEKTTEATHNMQMVNIALIERKPLRGSRWQFCSKHCI